MGALIGRRGMAAGRINARNIDAAASLSFCLFLSFSFFLFHLSPLFSLFVA